MHWSAYNNFVMPAYRMGFRIAALFDEKARKGLEGRRRWEENFKTQMKLLPAGQRIWFHATSVGEFLQARPIMDLIHLRYPRSNILLTFYSPSVEEMVEDYERAAVKGYLPLDTSENMRKLLNILRPNLIVFSKFDVWPNLLIGAFDREIHTALIDGTLSENSSRLKYPANKLFGDVFQKIGLIAAISEDDGKRFEDMGVDPETIEVTGDTRYDQTFKKANSVEDNDPIFEHFSGLEGFIVIAGSSWPKDEEVILPAFKELIKWEAHSKLILVPHEPTDDHIAKVSKKIQSFGMYSALLSDIEIGEPARDANVIIVNRVGVLAKLYKLGNIAIVGGSWKSDVHNVMEPAAFEMPIIVGPKHKNSHEAMLMISRGGAFQAKSSGELAETLLTFARDTEARDAAGDAALKVVMENTGATERTLTALEQAFPDIFENKS